MSAPGRLRKERRDVIRNREAIVAAARRVFRGDGLDAPLDAVAKAAGVGGATLYRHFPTRDALWEVVLEQPLDHLAAVVEDALALDDAAEGLERFLYGLGELEAGPSGFVAILTTRYPAGSSLARRRGRVQDGIEALVAAARSGGGVAGDVEETDVALLATGLEAVIAATRDAAPDAWRRWVHLVLTGVLSRPPTVPAPRAMRRNEVWRAFTRSARPARPERATHGAADARPGATGEAGVDVAPGPGTAP